MDRRKINDYERGSEALAVLHSLLSYGDNLHYEKFSNGSVKCIEDEIPFDIPGSWAWVRISSICVINPKNDLNDDTEVSFIPMPHICEGYENRHSFDIRKWSEIKTGYTHFAENDIGIAKITPCFENRKSVVFHNLKNGAGAGTTELFILRPIISVEPDYLLWIAKTDDFINGGVETFSAAVGQQRVDRDFIVNYLIPLPPVNEQKSIINKINVAFSVINTVDQNKADLANTIFYAKSKILDLAIRGQLVPQNPDDEPASVLLERIRAEKEELIKQGKLKRDKKESVIFRGEDNSYYEKMADGKLHCLDNQLPFELPDGWEWCNLSMIGTTNIGLTYRPTDIEPGGIMVLRSCNIVNDQVDLSGLVRVKTTVRENQFAQKNDILICARNGSRSLVGKCALIPDLREPASFGAFMAIYRTEYFEFIVHYLRSSFFRSVFDDSNSTAINQLTQDMLKRAIVPLPPLSEQRRIVEAIGAMLFELNQIEKSLS